MKFRNRFRFRKQRIAFLIKTTKHKQQQTSVQSPSLVIKIKNELSIKKKYSFYEARKVQQCGAVDDIVIGQ